MSRELSEKKRAADLIQIGEIARRSGVAASALRFYEQQGLIESVRDASGARRYPRSVLRRIAFIGAARRLGLSLEEIHAALDGLPRGRTPTKADWAAISSDWKPRLDRQIEQLISLRDDLTGCIGCGCLSLRKCALYNLQDKLAADGPGAARWKAAPNPPRPSSV